MKPTTFDHLKSKKKPLERRVPIYTDDDVIAALEKAQAALEAAKTRETALRPRAGLGEASPGHGGAQAALLAAQDQVEQATTAVEESVVWVVFRSPGRKAYDQLVGEHPPTKQQVEECKEAGLQTAPYNGETFAPALISLCAADPPISPAQAAVLSEEWNTNELMDLFTAAMAVATQRRVDVLGKSYG